MFKRIISSIMCVCLVASFTACGKEVELEKESSNAGSNLMDGLNINSTLTIDPNTVTTVKNFTAPKVGEEIVVIKIKDMGDIKIKLFPEYAPKGVENFVELAKTGYYDELIFHRVINNFMIQGGDPKGNGTGGQSIWGEKFDGGTSDQLTHVSGAIAYANSGATSTNGSQFYIVTGELFNDEYLSQIELGYNITFADDVKELYKTIGGAPYLDGNYTIFGQVIDGLDIVYAIQQTSVDTASKPYDAVVMESVTVETYNGEEVKWFIGDYADSAE